MRHTPQSYYTYNAQAFISFYVFACASPRSSATGGERYEFNSDNRNLIGSQRRYLFPNWSKCIIFSESVYNTQSALCMPGLFLFPFDIMSFPGAMERWYAVYMFRRAEWVKASHCGALTIDTLPYHHTHHGGEHSSTYPYERGTRVRVMREMIRLQFR